MSSSGMPSSSRCAAVLNRYSAFGPRPPWAEAMIRELYVDLLDADIPFLTTDLATAELVKVSANAFLATKISFINAVAEVCEAAGADVRELDPEQLWASMALVPQKAFLFSGTIASNLRQAKPEATDDELWEALRVAQAEDFVRALDLGLDAPVAQGGSNLSGGQRQRLSIARAIVRRPAIYLLDDSFSALDLTTDARLRAALRPVVADSVVLVVAQRVSSIIDADHIVVLDGGRLLRASRTEAFLDQTGTLSVELIGEGAHEQVPLPRRDARPRGGGHRRHACRAG